MISRALQMLYDEHDVILKAINKLQQLLKENNLPTKTESLRSFIRFFQGYGDVFHHHKEENTLFPLLTKKNEMLGMTIIEALEEHHSEFRETLLDISDALDKQDWETVTKELGRYLSDLADHISAENDELFVAAEMELTEEEKEKLYFDFLDQEMETGTEKKKEWEKQIDAL